MKNAIKTKRFMSVKGELMIDCQAANFPIAKVMPK
jgi:hypothetical protein